MLSGMNLDKTLIMGAVRGKNNFAQSNEINDYLLWVLCKLCFWEPLPLSLKHQSRVHRLFCEESVDAIS
jgi:hypothetical protein